METLYHWETTNRLEKIEKNLDRLFELYDKIHNLSGGNTTQPCVTALKKLERTGDQLDQLIDEIEVGFPASCTTESIIEKLKAIKAGLHDPV